MDCNTIFVDIGNSSIAFKCGTTYNVVSITDFLPKHLPKHNNAIISCVANTHILEIFPCKDIITPHAYPNITFNYSLKQLGTDRFLAIIAALDIFPTTNSMIIDIGTCITIDYIIENVHYSGGISPGIQLMRNSFNFSGEDSINAWNNGINDMITSYISDKINAFQGNVLLTGGGQNIVNISSPNISYHQNLVITGLEVLQN